jgi:molybdopterin synthase sulfur carrier subunit
VLVTVRLFARLKEIARGDALVTVPPGARVRDVWQALAVKFPEIAPYETAISCAVNADYSKMSAEVQEGDVVAFLPPVSGG